MTLVHMNAAQKENPSHEKNLGLENSLVYITDTITSFFFLFLNVPTLPPFGYIRGCALGQAGTGA